MITFQLINNIAIDTVGGGAELFAIRLCEHLNQENETHLLIVWRYHSEFETEILTQINGKFIVHFLSDSYERNLRNYVVISQRLLNLISQISPNIINGHSAFPDLLCLLAKIIYCRSVIICRTVHTDRNWFTNKALETFFGDIIFPIVFDVEIAISKATKNRLDDRFISKLMRKKSVIINNGLPNKTLELKNKRGFKKNDSEINIISIGRLTKQKGYTFLLEAIFKLKNMENVHFTILGEGPEKDQLVNYAKELELNNISFKGYQPNAIEYMLHSDLFVSSSIWEGFPTVILEAMAVGLPIVATDVSGSRELIENNYSGILVPPKNSKALADAIYEILNSPTKARRFISNAHNIVKKFSMDSVTKQYLKIYNELLQQ